MDFREGDEKFFEKKKLMEEQLEIKKKDKLIFIIKGLIKFFFVWGNKVYVVWIVVLVMIFIVYYIFYMFLVSYY